MPPKKAIVKSDSVSVVVNETVSKTKTKKVSEPEKEETVTKSKTKKTNKPVESELEINENIEPEKVEVEEIKKSKTKKLVEPEKIKTKKIVEPEKIKIKKTDESEKIKKITELEKQNTVSVTTDNISILPKTDNTEYNALKIEWGILCEKIKESNKEKELLEIQKNQLLNKLWKLGETSYPKTDIFDITDKPKLVQKISSIQTKILDNDSSDDNSDESESESESEVEKPKKNKIITKKLVIKSDSETSDSDSD